MPALEMSKVVWVMFRLLRMFEKPPEDGKPAKPKNVDPQYMPPPPEAAETELQRRLRCGPGLLRLEPLDGRYLIRSHVTQVVKVS